MDRLSRVIAAGASVLVLGTVVFSSGCRSMRNDVPPGKPYTTTGGPPPFTSDPRPGNSMGLYPNGAIPGSPGDPNAASGGASAPAQIGTPTPNAAPYMPSTSGLTRSGPGSYQ
jgi:hypothetical protein